MKRLTVSILIMLMATTSFAISNQQLSDSLDLWAGFNLGCVPKVKVTHIKVKRDFIWVYTNKTLSGLSLSDRDVRQLRLKVSMWVRGDAQGKVTIYSENDELGDLITHRLRSRSLSDCYTIPNARRMGKALTNQHIALWASHGIYYNQDEDRWKAQRATMWTTVEDVYTTDYAELVSQCLERAGANVYSPRARYGRDSAATDIGLSGYPRWTEGARYWLEYTNVPDSIWQPRPAANDNPNYFTNDSVRKDYLDDLRSRGNWVNWLNQQVPITLAIALHTDGYSQAGDSTTIGTLAIYSPENRYHHKSFSNGTSRIVNRDLADYVQTQVVEDIRAAYCPTWSRRQLHSAGYCESKYTEVPSVLLEILSHKQFADIQFGLNPRFRHDVARAIYKGIGRWIHSQVNTPFVVQPLAVQRMAVRVIDQQLHLTWQATSDTLEPTAEPTYFVIEMRQNGGEWQEVAQTKKCTYSFTPKHGVRYDMRVVAANEGGLSENSETLSAFIASDEAPLALIINAFDTVRAPRWFADSTFAGIVPRSYSIPDGEDGIFIGDQCEYNRALDWVSDDDCGWGMCYRDQLGLRQIGNTHDYPVHHGAVLAKMGISYVSANIHALDTIDSVYTLVDVVCGKEQRPLPSFVQHYQSMGGRLLVSGAYIGTVPNASANGLVQTPAMETTLQVFSNRPNEARLCAEDCHAFAPKKEQTVLARFADSGLPACVRLHNTLLWAVPIDCFESFESILHYSYEEITHP